MLCCAATSLRRDQASDARNRKYKMLFKQFSFQAFLHHSNQIISNSSYVSKIDRRKTGVVGEVKAEMLLKYAEFQDGGRFT